MSNKIFDKTGMLKYPEERKHLIKWATTLIGIANNNETEIHNIISGLKTVQSGIQLSVDKLMVQRQSEVEKYKKILDSTTQNAMHIINDYRRYYQ